MPKFLKHIEVSELPITTANIKIGNINCVMQTGSYINLPGFIGLLQDYTNTSKVGDLPFDLSFGLKQNFGVEPTKINGSFTQHQTPRYIQNQNDCVKNKVVNCVGTSSDLKLFVAPTYSIDVNNVTNVIKTRGGKVDVKLSFSGVSKTYEINVHKFNQKTGELNQVPVLQTDKIDFDSEYTIETNGFKLNSDGDYITRVYYQDDVTTEYLKGLGKTIDTNRGGKIKFNPKTDNHFMVIQDVEMPIFTQENEKEMNITRFKTSNVMPSYDGQTVVNFRKIGKSDIVVYLNGYTLSENIDFMATDKSIFFTDSIDAFTSNQEQTGLTTSDVISVLSIDGKNTGIQSESIHISTLPTGDTTSLTESGGYYDSTINEDVIITELDIISLGSITINGITLIPNIDYEVDELNKRRVVLYGDLLINDIILIVYQAQANITREISGNELKIGWSLTNTPQTDNGFFELKGSKTKDMVNHNQIVTIPYDIVKKTYNGTLNLSDIPKDSDYYYQVTNYKKYKNIFGVEFPQMVSTEIIKVTKVIE